MPKKLVKSEFRQTFDVQKMVINEETAFAFNMKSVTEFRNKVLNFEGFTKFLAAAEYYNNKNFNSLAKKFGVSQTAMAIRLKELELLEF